MDLGQIQQSIGTPAHDHLHLLGNDPAQDDPITVLPIHPDDGLLCRQMPTGHIRRNGLTCRREFPLIAPIAASTKGAQPMMGMDLLDGGACAHDLSPPPSFISRPAHILQPTSWWGKGNTPRNSSLSCGITGAIHIKDQIVLSTAIPQAAE